MRKNTFKIRALALTLSAASIFTFIGPVSAGTYRVEASTNVEETERKESQKQGKKIIKTTYEGILDGLALAFPEFKPFGPFLKYFGNLLFDTGSTENPNAEIMKKLEEIDAEIKKSVQELKDSTYNAIQLSNIGDKYNTLVDKADTIRTRIGNYERNVNLTAEQKQQKIADLYNDSEFQNLESAMNGATRCFMSKANDIFENQSIFDAAYGKACQAVMFSGEAIDLTAPYILRQLNNYVAAYAVMGEVYDAYEAIYGEGSLNQSRETMYRRLAGCDLDGNKVDTSVLEVCSEYFSGDRLIFVNKSITTKIKLNEYLIFKDKLHSSVIKDPNHYASWVETPDYMKNMPLNKDQVTALFEYCYNKKTTIFDLLLNRVGFKVEQKRRLGKNNIVSCWTLRNGVYKPKGMVFLAAGAQELEKHRPGGGKCWVTYNVFEIAGNLNGQMQMTLTQANVEAHGVMSGNVINDSPYLLFFQGR